MPSASMLTSTSIRSSRWILPEAVTNIQPGKEFGKGPMNMFVSIPAYPPADQGGRAAQLRYALFVAWLDLTKGPAVVSVPDTDGRYYLLPMLDMWTDVFASPGWRTTGTAAGKLSASPHPAGPAQFPRA